MSKIINRIAYTKKPRNKITPVAGLHFNMLSFFISANYYPSRCSAPHQNPN